MIGAARWLVPIYLALSVLLGGASAGGYVANAGLQLLAIGLLVLSVVALPDPPAERAERAVMILFAAVFLLICVQFVPLPEALWRSLPGRAALLRPIEAAGIVWRGGFVSLIPHESFKSGLWLLPASGVAFAMMRARVLYSGRRLALALVAVTCLSVLWGALQLAAGSASALYFYHFTNRGFAVGFFANANHMASLLLVTIPFQAALLRDALERKDEGRIAGTLGVIGSFAVTITGIVVVGSLAGYGLLLPVSLASALIVRGNRGMRLGVGLLLIPAVVGGMGLILATQEGRAMLDQASSMATGSRQAIFTTSWRAIHEYWPAGTGLGTFAEAYPSYENPLTVAHAFVNHAHNDYLELLLETGLAGAVLLLAFLLWWAVRAWQIWGSSMASPYATAAVIASATLLVHSLVDYPLRTAGLSCTFAACLALMAAPRPRTWSGEREAIFGRD